MNEGPVPPASEPSPQGGISQEDKTMGMLAHLLAVFTGFIGPLVIWLIKKDQSEFVNDQGKEALNFQITMILAWIAGFILTLVTLGFGAIIIYPVLWIGNLVLCIMACVAANKGECYRYPICLRLIK